MFKRIVTLAAVLAVLASSCAAGTPEAAPTTETPTSTSPASTVAPTTTTLAVQDFPVTIETVSGPVTIDDRPTRIISISPTATEILFAVGAGDQIVAVDDFSNYPEGAPVSDLSAWTPNVEAIAAFEPDLVILSFDPGDIVAGLEAVGIDVILHLAPATLDDVFVQWEQTGAVTGHAAEAEDLVEGVQDRIESSLASLPESSNEWTYYYELDNTLYTATSSSFIGSVIGLTGLTNVADAAPDPDGFGFPQLSEEYILDVDPTLILLADTKCCGQSLGTVGERPGWLTLSAVQSGSVVELDDDVASRWSPRIVDLLDAIVAAIVSLES